MPRYTILQKDVDSIRNCKEWWKNFQVLNLNTSRKKYQYIWNALYLHSNKTVNSICEEKCCQVLPPRMGGILGTRRGVPLVTDTEAWHSRCLLANAWQCQAV